MNEKANYVANKQMFIFALPTIMSILITILVSPALPSIQTTFSLPINMIQLVISLNLAGYAISLLFYGWLIDHYGRRPVLLVAMVLLILLTLACAITSSFTILIIARFSQGIAAGGLSIIVLTSIKDIYTEKAAVKAYAIYGMVSGITPVLGALAGGLIVHYGNWRLPFFIIAIFAAVTTILLALFFPESLEKHKKENFKSTAKIYLKLITKGSYLFYALLVGVLWSTMYKFIGVLPFIYEKCKLSILVSSGLLSLVILMFSLGNFFSIRINEGYKAEKIISVGIKILLLVSFLQTLFYFIFPINYFVITLFSMMLSLGVGMMFSSVTAKAISSAQQRQTGSAVALLSFIEWSLSSLTVYWVTSYQKISMSYNLSALIAIGIIFIGLTIETKNSKNI